jgi:hypothetical protein
MEPLLSQIDTLPIIKDITFWHLLATASCGLLIKMFNKHMTKIEATLEKVTEMLIEVKSTNEIQDYKINNHEERLLSIEKKRKT